MYSTFKSNFPAVHNTVGFTPNLVNILGLSLSNTFLAGNTPFSPNKPVNSKLDYINEMSKI